MNIYNKINAVSLELQKKNLKKSGKNKFAGYNYYELADFLPPLVELFDEFKISVLFSYTSDIATMTVVNCDLPEERVQYTCPMTTLSLKGANDIQNLGGSQTYIRRYLLMSAFHIIENDYFDAIKGKNEHQKESLIEEIKDLCKKKIDNGTPKTSLSKDIPELKNLYNLSISDLKSIKSKVEGA